MDHDTAQRFQRSLALFCRRLTGAQLEECKQGDRAAVETSIHEIQEKLGPEKRLRNLNSLRKFLDGMKQVEELVTIFLNTSDVLAFIWAPIKVTMMIAARNVEALEKVLDAYRDIGETIHGMGQYSRLFKDHPEAREILGFIFDDILHIHEFTLDAFFRPGWRKFLTTTGFSFKARLQPILDSLKRRRGLLADEKLTVLIDEIQSCRTENQAQFSEIKQILQDGLEGLKSIGKAEPEALLAQKRIEVHDKLDPPDFNSDQERARSSRYSHLSGDWIHEDPKMVRWESISSNPSNILYLHGGPGSGKTTLVSRIVEKFQSSTAGKAMVFFYFKNDDENKTCMGKMLRALLAQIIKNDDIIMEYLHHKSSRLTKSELHELPVMQGLAKDCFDNIPHNIWIILDGLDECTARENGTDTIRAIVQWFELLMQPTSLASGRVRLLISGQRNGCLEQLLSRHPDIQLDTSLAHIQNIGCYCQSRASEIGKRFSLSRDRRDEIVKRVKELSRGMFLYAKVVLDNLSLQTSKAEFEDELRTENFPKELNAAYERVALRIFTQASEPSRESAKKILAWVITSPRPLRWREIQSRFCINVDRVTSNSEYCRVDSCKALCGSLVDLEASASDADSELEKTVNLVHQTAGQYLVHRRHINILEEHAKMAIFCCRYLSSPPFTDVFAARTAQLRRDAVCTGYYGFQDYAVANWDSHFKAIARQLSELSPAMQSDLVQSARSFLNSYYPNVATGQHNLTSPARLTDRYIQCFLDTWFENEEHSNALESSTQVIRESIESILHDSQIPETSLTTVRGLMGVIRFKCSKAHCSKFNLGFPTKETRDHHIREHERPFKCTEEGCYANSTGFHSTSALDTHTKRHHAQGTNPSELFAPRRKRRAKNILEACEFGDLDRVKELHCEKVDQLFSPRRGGETPLRQAVKSRHIHVCEYLIEYGADIFDSRFRDEAMPIDIPLANGDLELFSFLIHRAGEEALSSFIKRSEDSYLNLVMTALASADPGFVDPLLHWKTASLSNEALHIFMENILYWRRRKMLNKMAGSPEGRNKMHRVVRSLFPSLYLSTVDNAYSIESEAHQQNGRHTPQELCRIISPSGDKAALFAITMREGYRDLALFVLELLRPEDIPSTLLLELIECSGDFYPEEILGTGIPDKENRISGQLPLLHLAAERRDKPKATQFLLSHTQDLDAEDDDGRTALEIAIFSNNGKMISGLVKSKMIDLQRKSKDGFTMFELAVKSNYNNLATMELLHDENPEVAFPRLNEAGESIIPLQLASLSDSPDTKVTYMLSLPSATENVLALLAQSEGPPTPVLGMVLKGALVGQHNDIVLTILRSNCGLPSVHSLFINVRWSPTTCLQRLLRICLENDLDGFASIWLQDERFIFIVDREKEWYVWMRLADGNPKILELLHRLQRDY